MDKWVVEIKLEDGTWKVITTPSNRMDADIIAYMYCKNEPERSARLVKV